MCRLLSFPLSSSSSPSAPFEVNVKKKMEETIISESTQNCVCHLAYQHIFLEFSVLLLLHSTHTSRIGIAPKNHIAILQLPTMVIASKPLLLLQYKKKEECYWIENKLIRENADDHDHDDDHDIICERRWHKYKISDTFPTCVTYFHSLFLSLSTLNRNSCHSVAPSSYSHIIWRMTIMQFSRSESQLPTILFCKVDHWTKIIEEKKEKRNESSLVFCSF